MENISFHGRKKEILFFKSLIDSNKAELCILYGRRRIGKTRICLELIKNNLGTYFLSSEISLTENLKRFRQELSISLNDELILSIEASVESLFLYLSKKKERIIIVIDEFPYLIESDKSVLSEFQRVWDLYLKNSNIVLILTGSSIAMIEDKILSYKSPLYGRRTAQYKLEELSFKESSYFFPNLDFETILKYYSICGGIPFYLEKINPKLNFKENLKILFNKGSILFEEGDFLLKQEFRQTQNYKLILREIAKGKTKFNEISLATQIESTNLTQYLKNLLILKLIKKEVSFGFDEIKSKGRYYLGDYFLEFWFKFIFVNQHLIQKDKLEDLFDIINNNLDIYLGFVYEKVSKEYLEDSLDFPIMKNWFYKEKEIDLVGLKNDILYLCECKYRNKKIGDETLTSLIEKSDYVNVKHKEKKFILISKSGFNKVKQTNVLLISNIDFQKWMKNK